MATCNSSPQESEPRKEPLPPLAPPPWDGRGTGAPICDARQGSSAHLVGPAAALGQVLHARLADEGEAVEPAHEPALARCHRTDRARPLPDQRHKQGRVAAGQGAGATWSQTCAPAWSKEPEPGGLTRPDAALRPRRPGPDPAAPDAALEAGRWRQRPGRPPRRRPSLAAPPRPPPFHPRPPATPSAEACWRRDLAGLQSLPVQKACWPLPPGHRPHGRHQRHCCCCCCCCDRCYGLLLPAVAAGVPLLDRRQEEPHREPIKEQHYCISRRERGSNRVVRSVTCGTGGRGSGTGAAGSRSPLSLLRSCPRLAIWAASEELTLPSG